MIRKIIAVLCTLFFGLILPISFFGGGLSASAAVLGLWPLDSSYRQITTYFDPERNNGNIYAGHNGIDIPANLNANIYAAADGVCVSSGWMDDYGNLVILWHEKLGVYTFYAHCSYYTVYAGQTVSAGEIIAHVGNTGVSQGNHLHFGICDNLVGGWPDIWYYDPLTFFTYKMEQDSGSCNCTEDYAGTYVTAGVDTYLNIRSGHGTGYSIVGQLYPYSEFVVTKADGTGSHRI